MKVLAKALPSEQFFIMSFFLQEDQLLGNNRSTRHVASAGSDSETESRQRMEPRSAMSSIQPLLQAHGMGNADPANKSKKVSFISLRFHVDKKVFYLFFGSLTVSPSSVQIHNFYGSNI